MSKNTANSCGAAIAAKVDFSDYHLADEPDVPMPAPVRRALLVSGGLIGFSQRAEEERL
jgi:hypothetical protein